MLANRTETPAGLGLAVQNRIHTANLLTTAAGQAGSRSLNEVLDGFSAEVRRRGQAAGAPDEALCVLLAGDPAQPGQADGKALGDRLGFPLVEGNDLAVRGASVFVKTLKGLKPVAAVLRLVESQCCDPLALSPTSLAGTPGLLNAATQGGVALINPIGSGAVESDALSPFLPALCERLLDEPLLLPSLATWWCGQPPEAAWVAERLDQLVVGDAFGGPCGLDSEPVPSSADAAAHGAAAHGAAHEALREAIRRQPYRFAGKEPLRLSTAPCLMPDGRLKPAPLTVRLFAAATPNGYRVLPGGLARTADGFGPLVKDVWIAGASPARFQQATANRPAAGVDAQAVQARDGSAILTRRLGDDLFWFGRHLERAQTSIRIFAVLARLITEGRLSNPEASEGLLQLLATLGFAAPVEARSPAAFDETGLCRLLFDSASDDALINFVEWLHRTGMRRRRILPAAAWQAIDDIHRAQQSRWRVRTVADALRLLDDLALRLVAVNGLMDETQPRDQGFWLQRLGKHIERLRLLATINLEFGVAQAPTDPNRVHLLLQLHNLGDIQAAWTARADAALHLLLCDADHPQSMRHQAQRIGLCLERLLPQGMSNGLTEAGNCASALGDELADACRRQGVMTDGEARRLLNLAGTRAGEISALVSAIWFERQTIREDEDEDEEGQR